MFENRLLARHTSKVSKESNKKDLQKPLSEDYQFLQKGKEAFSAKLFQAAIDNYKKAVFCNPNNFEAWYELGSAYYQIKEYQNALTAINKTLSINANYKQALLKKAQVLIALNRADEASKILNEIH